MADGSDGPILNPWTLSIGSEVCEPLTAFAGPIDPRDPPEVRARSSESRSLRVGIRRSEPSASSAGSLRSLFLAASGLTVRLTGGATEPQETAGGSPWAPIVRQHVPRSIQPERCLELPGASPWFVFAFGRWRFQSLSKYRRKPLKHWHPRYLRRSNCRA
jgi:hypothetical protein